MSRRLRFLAVAGVLAALGLGVAYYFYRPAVVGAGRIARLRAYLGDPGAYVAWQIRAGERCEGAPFVLPTDGLLGFGYGDGFRPGRRHQGFDIFGPAGLGETPVLAAYAGYLTRLADWKSTVIIRIPDDPLEAGRQIWAYYTHMADAQGSDYISAAFPPGTVEQYVAEGTLLGYQGNYSGNPGDPVGMHLHFSIVKDDGEGRFLNELQIENTLDPSAYLGLAGGVEDDWSEPVVCAGG